MPASRIPKTVARFSRGVYTLAGLAAAYWAYALLAAPLIEPSSPGRLATSHTRSTSEFLKNPLGRYDDLLAAYFPQRHWARSHPKVLESRQALLLWDDYKINDGPASDNEQVELSACAIVFFPRPRANRATPPRDAIILEAPQGALLDFDGGFDLGRGQFKLSGGLLRGPVTIHSDMQQPGPDDDLWIATRDVTLSPEEIWTPHDVQFRLGLHYGRGTDLRIHLLEEDERPAARSALNVARVGWLELSRNVELHAFFAGDDILPGAAITDRRQAGEANPSGEATGGSAVEGESRTTRVTPIEVTCQGPFHFDLVQYVATFDEAVQVLRHQTSGPSDVGRLDRLSIYFEEIPNSTDKMADKPTDAPADRTAAATASDPSTAAEGPTSKLRPVRLEGFGTPVQIDVPSRKAYARSASLRYWPQTRRIELDGPPGGGERVMLFDGPSELVAPSATYTFADDGRRLGTAQAPGPGVVRYVNRNDASSTFTVQWSPQQQLTLQRIDGEPVVAITPRIAASRGAGQPPSQAIGRADMDLGGRGRLSTNTFFLWLAEMVEQEGSTPVSTYAVGAARGVAGGDDAAAAKPVKPKIQVIPSRLRAEGDVVLASPQLNASTEALEAWFTPAPAPPTPLPPTSDAEPSPAGLGAASPRGGRNDVRRRDSPETSMLVDDRPQRSHEIQGRLIQLELTLPPASAGGSELTQARAQGDVSITERDAEGRATWRVLGDQVDVTDANTDQTKVVVHQLQPAAGDASRGGSADTGPLVDRRARVETQSVTMIGPQIHLDRGVNRAWIDAAGEIILQSPQSADQPVQPAPTTITWLGGMDFDGRVIRLRDDVVVRSPNQVVQTPLLLATLSKPVRFGESVDSKSVDIAMIETYGKTTLDNLGADQGRTTSRDHMVLDGVPTDTVGVTAGQSTLLLNRETGEILGQGPGTLSSVRYRESISNSAGATEPSGPSDPSTERPRQLNFLEVRFLAGLDGRFHESESRRITLEQIRLHQIRAIYGPVANWDQRLEMYDRPHGPLANELLLSSDHLIVDQLTSPGGQRPHVELTALGNVATEVASANGDEFNARSHTLTYDQSKDLITLRGATLEGGGRIDATVWRNNSPRPIEAGEIEFNPLAGGQIRIIDGSHLELNQLGALQ